MSTAPSRMDITDVLAMLDGRRSEPAEGTQRRYQRFPVRGEAQLEPLDTGSLETPTSVLLRDLSRGGIGFLCDHAIQPGSMYRVRFHANGNAFGSQPVVICYCRLVQDNLYMIGGQFIIEPYIMALIGVAEADLACEQMRQIDPLDVSDFVDPETELGPA